MTAPVLIGCSHGTSDPAGRAAVRTLLDAVRAARPGLEVREAFVDVQEPEVGDVVSDVVGQEEPRDAVVVPLLLSAGYHVRVDVSEAVRARPTWSGRAAAAPALGPDPRLVDVALDRLAEAGVGPDDAVVVAAAGSSRPEAGEDVEEFVSALRRVRRGPVLAGYGAMATPTVAEAVATARTGRPRVAVLAYLLAPGFFHDRVRAAGGDVVTRPLGPDRRIADVVLDRYDREVTRLRARPVRLHA